MLSNFRKIFFGGVEGEEFPGVALCPSEKVNEVECGALGERYRQDKTEFKDYE
jgi:hypothetical protein